VRLERLESALAGAGAEQVVWEVPYGSPIREILRIAGQQRQTFIVMGSQGRGFISEVLLGSVSHQIARLVVHPVLLVPAVRAGVFSRRQRSQTTVTAVTFL
jgi:nucleotide-binding universal stress UspA family protein